MTQWTATNVYLVARKTENVSVLMICSVSVVVLMGREWIERRLSAVTMKDATENAKSGRPVVAVFAMTSSCMIL